MKMAAMKRTDAEDILIKDPQREQNGDNKESGRRAYTDQKNSQRDVHGDNKESGRRGYTEQFLEIDAISVGRSSEIYTRNRWNKLRQHGSRAGIGDR